MFGKRDKSKSLVDTLLLSCGASLRVSAIDSDTLQIKKKLFLEKAVNGKKK